MGPLIRLFDDGFSLETLRQEEFLLRVEGQDGYSLEGRSSVARISRPFEELVAATFGKHHQYPDGFALFTGTLFAPTRDRDEPGQGFTHHMGDVATIRSRHLGPWSTAWAPRKSCRKVLRSAAIVRLPACPAARAGVCCSRHLVVLPG
ncbi:fumarylacetoacetate (FAA) hydrolase family protein [Arthrobacter sp. UYCu712]